jgi:RNA polymerase sigma factor (TIGR02999 family)
MASSSGEPAPDITRLLQDWRNGEPGALDHLTRLVYDELHLIAARQLSREWRVSMYQTTALVSEAYLKLMGQRNVDWQNRAHFFAIAAHLMRRILVDHARRERRPKHGGGMRALELEEAAAVASPATDEVDTVALDDALKKLEALDPDQARVVELRFFGGLTIEEAAEVMGVSPATIKREWAVAKGWLYRELGGRVSGG